jgi:hypothetical protein
MNIIDRIPRQSVPLVYLCLVLYAVFAPASVFRDGVLLGLSCGSIALALLATFALRDIKRTWAALDVVVACNKALIDQCQTLVNERDGARAERDAWKEEAERLREFQKQTIGVTIQ